VKGEPVTKPKADPTLGEILSGVDIIGTMLHIDMPRLEQQIQEIKALLSAPRPGEHALQGESGETASALEDIKEMLQLQNERLLSLERRLSHLTSICEQWGTARPNP
jgi:hypothetical protein